MSSKRILIFSLAYHPVIGGAEIAVKEITDRIDGVEFDMITRRFDKSHPAQEKIGNVNVYRIDSSKFLFPMEAFMFAKALHLRRPYDAIWSIMAAYAGFAAMFFKSSFPEVKYILTLQEGDPIDYIKKRTRFVSPLFKRIFTKADVVQAISNYLADYARAMGYAGEVEVIPNGVDIEFFSRPDDSLKKVLGKREDEIFLITTSRLVKKNGIKDVIKAMAILPPNVRFIVVGEGPDLSQLLKLAWELKVDRRVQFVGHVTYEDVPKYLAASDIFIRPSLSEGFGNSFIEAMAAGLPVVATPVGGIVDFLYDPEANPNISPTGLFVKPEDPVTIREQIMRLIEDEELRETLIKNAREMVEERYQWNFVAQEIKKLVFDKV